MAKRAEMQPSLFNGYYNGSHRPSLEGLEKICRVFDKPERAALAAAHLRDELPSSAADLVRIVNLVESPRTEEESGEAYSKTKLPKKVMKDFEFLMQQAENDAGVIAWIKSTVDVLRGR